MLDIEGPFFHQGHNMYRRVKVADSDEQFGTFLEEIEAWIGMFCDEASARGAAEAMNVRASCAWEYSISGDDPDAVPRRRMAFHSEWEDVPDGQMPEEIEEALRGLKD